MLRNPEPTGVVSGPLSATRLRCIESITACEGHPFCVTETCDGIVIHRLYYNLLRYARNYGRRVQKLKI